MDNVNKDSILIENGFKIADLSAYAANIDNIGSIVNQLVSLRDKSNITIDLNDFTNILERLHNIDNIFGSVTNVDDAALAFKNELNSLKGKFLFGNEFLSGQDELKKAQKRLEESDKNYASLEEAIHNNPSDITLTQKANSVIYERDTSRANFEHASKNATETKERYEQALTNIDPEALGEELFNGITRLTTLYHKLSALPETMDSLNNAIYAARDKIVELGPVKAARYKKEYNELLSKAGLIDDKMLAKQMETKKDIVEETTPEYRTADPAKEISDILGKSTVRDSELNSSNLVEENLDDYHINPFANTDTSIENVSNELEESSILDDSLFNQMLKNYDKEEPVKESTTIKQKVFKERKAVLAEDAKAALSLKGLANIAAKENNPILKSAIANSDLVSGSRTLYQHHVSKVRAVDPTYGIPEYEQSPLVSEEQTMNPNNIDLVLTSASSFGTKILSGLKTLSKKMRENSVNNFLSNNEDIKAQYSKAFEDNASFDMTLPDISLGGLNK